MTKKALITNSILMIIAVLSMFWNYFQASGVSRWGFIKRDLPLIRSIFRR